MEKTDLQKAFAYSRRNWFHGGAYSGPGGKPRPAREALDKARGLIAALPALEEQEAAARAALEAQRAIDGRRYAPGMEAARAGLEKARKAHLAGRAWKYAGPVWTRGYTGTWQSEPGLYFVADARSTFRNVEKAAEVGGRYNRLGIPEGYYLDPYQDSLCIAYVVQLRGRNGRAFFAPAYQFTESDDDGMTVDLRPRAIKESNPAGDSENMQARKEAARAADQLAEKVAEEEREYQTAWAAGSEWARLKEEEEEERREALAILKERKAARALDPAGFPALCAALRGTVESILESIREKREERAKLAQGDGPELYFYAGEERLRAAFCEGAGLEGFPA